MEKNCLPDRYLTLKLHVIVSLTQSDDFFVGVGGQSAVAALVNFVAVNELLLRQVQQLSSLDRPLTLDIA